MTDLDGIVKEGKLSIEAMLEALGVGTVPPDSVAMVLVKFGGCSGCDARVGAMLGSAVPQVRTLVFTIYDREKVLNMLSTAI